MPEKPLYLRLGIPPFAVDFRIKPSAGALVEKDGRLLLVNIENHWSIPSGRTVIYPDDPYLELNHPQITMYHELLEETGVVSEAAALWGLMVYLKWRQISYGLIYRVRKYSGVLNQQADDEVHHARFFSPNEVTQLIEVKKIRKTKWNLPVLNAWLSHKPYLLMFRVDK